MPILEDIKVPGEEGYSPPGGVPVYEAVCGISVGDYTGTTAIADAIDAGETSIGVLAGTYDCSSLGDEAGKKGHSGTPMGGITITGLGAKPDDVIFKHSVASSISLFIGSDITFNHITLEDTVLSWPGTAIQDITFNETYFTKNAWENQKFLDGSSNPSKNVYLYNCKFFGTSSTGASVFLYTDGFEMINCKIIDMKGKFEVYGKNGAYGIVHINYFENSYGFVLESDYDELEANFTISENSFLPGTGDRWYWGPQVEAGVCNVDILNNRVIGVDGMAFNSNHKNVRMIGNYIITDNYHGIEINGKLTDCAIEDNTIVGGYALNKEGISDTVSYTHTRLSVKNNNIKHFADYGMYLYATEHSNISDNNLTDCHRGLSVASNLNYSKVNNNTIVNTSVSGTSTGTDATGVTLTDSTASFLTTAKTGMKLYNETDGSVGTITDIPIGGLQIVCLAGLSGGTDDEWSPSDVYSISWANSEALEFWDVVNSQINGNVLYNDNMSTGLKGILVGGSAVNCENYDVSHNNIANFGTNFTDTPAEAQKIGNIPAL